MSSGESTMTPWWHTSRWWRTRYDPSVSKPSSESFPKSPDPEIILFVMTAAACVPGRSPATTPKSKVKRENEGGA